MPDPISAFVLSFVDALNKLWDKSLTLLSAFAVICVLLLGISALGLFFHVGFAADLGSVVPWLVGGAIVFGVLSLAKIIERRFVRTFHVILDDQSSFWHKAPQAGGKIATQLDLHFRVTNLTGGPLILSGITIKRPLTFGAPIVKTLSTYSAQQGDYDSGYYVHPRGTTTAHSMFLIERDIGTAGKRLRVIADLIDQRGNRTRLKCRLESR